MRASSFLAVALSLSIRSAQATVVGGLSALGASITMNSSATRAYSPKCVLLISSTSLATSSSSIVAIPTTSPSVPLTTQSSLPSSSKSRKRCTLTRPSQSGNGSTSLTTSTILSTPTSAAPFRDSTTIAMTTSTVYTTSTYTVSKCPATVTNCPIGSVTTEVISLYTTVCPVTATELPSAQATSLLTTSTVYTTNIYTITKCPATVTNCPVGSVTTDIISLYTTVCPVTETATNPVPASTLLSTPALGTPTQPGSGFTTSTVYTTNIYTITKCPATVTNCPVGSVTTEIVSLYTTVGPVAQSTVQTALVSEASGVPAGSVASALLSPVASGVQTQAAAGQASVAVASQAVSSTILPVNTLMTAAWNNVSSTSTSASTKPQGTAATLESASPFPTYAGLITSGGVKNWGVSTALLLVTALVTLLL